jgi:hypothetical protein
MDFESIQSESYDAMERAASDRGGRAMAKASSASPEGERSIRKVENKGDDRAFDPRATPTAFTTYLKELIEKARL